MNFLKKFTTKLALGLALLIGVLTPTPARAIDFFTVTNVTAATPFTILSGGKYTITELLFANTSTNTGTVKFYDTTGSATNIVRAAYTSVTSYSTNITTVFTNSSGLLITNITPGIFTSSSTVAATTNEAPVLVGPLMIVASETMASDGMAVSPVRGFTIYSTVAGQIQITYKKAYP